MPTRRQLLHAGAAGALLPLLSRARARELPPVRRLTQAPGHHWFGYYDKLQFDARDTRVLGMRVDFEHRTPRADDVVQIGTVDLDQDRSWHALGTSSAWGWQQGCMLQWRPGHPGQVLWNDRGADGFVCRLLDVESGELRTLPAAVYALAPDGRWAVAADFARIQALRPGYGYVGRADRHAGELEPDGTGVFRVDLDTGERRLLVSIAAMARVGERSPDMEGAKHYVNHLLVSPDGERVVFLHRWRPDGGRAGFRTRMLTASPDGEDLFVLDPSGRTSHFIWEDGEHLLAWSKPAGRPAGFYRFRDRTNEVQPFGAGVLTKDGHLSLVPEHPGWFVSDTYPDRERREQHPHLFHEESGRVLPLGHFHSPPEYRGEWRCDTHPRTSRDGRTVVVDSAHGGDGRQMWAIDVGELLDGA